MLVQRIIPPLYIGWKLRAKWFIVRGMILECPQCSARFLVADAMLLPSGRTVRCGACAHQWFATLPGAQAAAAETVGAMKFDPGADEIEPLKSGANVPAIRPRRLSRKPFMIAVPVIAALWLGLAFFAYFPRWMNAPVLGGIYHMFGVTSTDGLVFADVHMERSTDGPKTIYILTGSVVNHAADMRVVPTVRVTLKDKKGHEIWARDYAVNAPLKAGDVYPFRITNVETSFATNVASIVLDLGHSLQLMMR